MITSPNALTFQNSRLLMKFKIGNKEKSLPIEVEKIEKSIEERYEDANTLLIEEKEKKE